MTDEELTMLVNKVADASGYGGLDSSTMYGEFALDVAKAVREECAKLCDAVVAEVSPRERYTSDYTQADLAAAVSAMREKCAQLVEPGDLAAWEARGGQEGIELMRDLAAAIRAA